METSQADYHCSLFCIVNTNIYLYNYRAVSLKWTLCCSVWCQILDWRRERSLARTQTQTLCTRRPAQIRLARPEAGRRGAKRWRRNPNNQHQRPWSSRRHRPQRPVKRRPALKTAEPPAAPSSPKTISKPVKRDEDEENDWLAGALSRKKTQSVSQSEDRERKQEVLSGLGEEVDVFVRWAFLMNVG